MRQESDERGSVTAELALAIPAVMMLLAIFIGAMGLQLERFRLVDLAATLARADARGESPEVLKDLIDQWQPSANFKVESTQELVCIVVTKATSILGLPEKVFVLAEKQCARKQGL
jgi:hypothetical protein